MKRNACRGGAALVLALTLGGCAAAQLAPPVVRQRMLFRRRHRARQSRRPHRGRRLPGSRPATQDRPASPQRSRFSRGPYLSG
jgi:hypothetical protein